MDFEIVGEITRIETISRGSGIRNYARLQRQYGQGRWRKLKGVAYVQLVMAQYVLLKFIGIKLITLARGNSRLNFHFLIKDAQKRESILAIWFMS